MLLVYQSLSVLIFIISPLIILIRIIKKREDTKRFKEKFCYFSKKRTSGKYLLEPEKECFAPPRCDLVDFLFAVTAVNQTESY